MKKKVWTIVGGKKTQNDPSSKSLERKRKGDFSIQFGEKTKTYTSSEKQCKVPTRSK